MSTDQNNKTTKQQDAAEFVTKSFFLAEVAANADPKIAEQNRQIAEQKMVFEAKKAKQAERERRRNRELSEKEKQANNEAALFITKSYSLTELAANADPKIAAQNRQIADQKKLFEAQALRAEEESKSPEQLVVDSWSKVKAIPNYQSVAGELLFRRIFELNANAAGLFQFAEDHSIDDDRMYKSVMFVKHSTAVISTVTAAIGLLEQGDMGMLFSVLIDLGARHAAFDLQKVHYDLVGESLMYTLEKALGESYTSKVKSGWVSVYGVITEKMMEGAKECEEAAKEDPYVEKEILMKEVPGHMVTIASTETIQMSRFRFWILLMLMGVGGWLLGSSPQDFGFDILKPSLVVNTDELKVMTERFSKLQSKFDGTKSEYEKERSKLEKANNETVTYFQHQLSDLEKQLEFQVKGAKAESRKVLERMQKKIIDEMKESCEREHSSLQANIKSSENGRKELLRKTHGLELKIEKILSNESSAVFSDSFKAKKRNKLFAFIQTIRRGKKKNEKKKNSSKNK